MVCWSIRIYMKLMVMAAWMNLWPGGSSPISRSFRPQGRRGASERVKADKSLERPWQVPIMQEAAQEKRCPSALIYLLPLYSRLLLSVKKPFSVQECPCGPYNWNPKFFLSINREEISISLPTTLYNNKEFVPLDTLVSFILILLS